jgi:transketolase|tara:strand:+ start:1820 stop:2590 length:771 start_codon:yes stop_codon:yes gene_type:complete
VNKKENKLIKNIRLNILKKTYEAKSSHIGSCYSIVEILYVLYFLVLKKKDTFILSKGHAALALYCTLFEKKFLSRASLNSYGKNNTKLMAHASHKVKGIEFSTGSLGHGLPYAVGRALGEKINKSNNKIYVLISDGELNEGTTWESLLFASFHKLSNLFIIIDYNKIQSLDFVKKVMKIEPLKKKLTAFNCNVSQINGHNINKITKSLNPKNNNKPTIIIANTIKGKGVKFMENTVLWHYKSPNKEQLRDALKDLK